MKQIRGTPCTHQVQNKKFKPPKLADTSPALSVRSYATRKQEPALWQRYFDEVDAVITPPIMKDANFFTSGNHRWRWSVAVPAMVKIYSYSWFNTIGWPSYLQLLQII